MLKRKIGDGFDNDLSEEGLSSESGSEEDLNFIRIIEDEPCRELLYMLHDIANDIKSEVGGVGYMDNTKRHKYIRDMGLLLATKAVDFEEYGDLVFGAVEKVNNQLECFAEDMSQVKYGRVLKFTEIIYDQIRDRVVEGNLPPSSVDLGSHEVVMDSSSGKTPGGL